jgi:hypothetical protein
VRSVHRRGDVGHLQKLGQVVAGEHEHREHAVGAVDEGQALLLGQLHRLQAGGAERLGRGPRLSVVHDIAFAHDGERDVREWSEVAGTAE